MSTFEIIILGVMIVSVLGLAFFFFMLFQKFDAKHQSFVLSSNSDKAALNVQIKTQSEMIAKQNDTLMKSVAQIESLSKENLELKNKLDEIKTDGKTIGVLSDNIISLQNILTDKKSRGNFGETNLYLILQNAFGDTDIWGKQVTLSNGAIADAVVKAPDPMGMIAIDSKFPLEHFRAFMDSDNETEKSAALSAFKTDMKKHIDAIAGKYILHNETSDSAILFLPSEAVFSLLHDSCQDMVEYSYKKNVWITSPTTLMATVTILLMAVRNIERSNKYDEMETALGKLSTEFGRYAVRWDKLQKTLKTVEKEVDDLSVTGNKLTKAFEKIVKADVDGDGNISDDDDE